MIFRWDLSAGDGVALKNQVYMLEYQKDMTGSRRQYANCPEIHLLVLIAIERLQPLLTTQQQTTSSISKSNNLQIKLPTVSSPLPMKRAIRQITSRQIRHVHDHHYRVEHLVEVSPTQKFVALLVIHHLRTGTSIASQLLQERNFLRDQYASQLDG
jgi:hypothetical protein